MDSNKPLCLVCSHETDLIRELSIDEVFMYSSERVPKEKLQSYEIYKCTNCNLEFSHPMPSKEVLDLYYSDYFDPRSRSDVVKENAIRNISHLREKYNLNENHKLLDFGCGDNIFLEVAKCSNWIGFDKYKFPNLPEDNFDFITLFGVLEHLTDPLKEIKLLNKRLNKGGKIIIITVGETETKIPYQYKVPEHVTFWNEKSIKELFSRSGFELKEFSPYRMNQDPEVFLDIIARVTKMESKTRQMLHLNLPENQKFVELPTNEMFIVGEKI